LELNPDGHAARKITVGTAYSTSSRIWYTFDHGGVTEIYYPTSDSQRIRNLQFSGA
jgi:glucoamylase